MTGKLLHQIKLLSKRTECLKDSEKEPIAETYELTAVDLETMRIFSHKSGDNKEAKTGTIQLKFKLIITSNIVHLANMAISQWQDPGNDKINPSWRQMTIQLATVKDSSTKLPERFCGETRLELNTSYLQLCTADNVTRWYRHIAKLPKWALEEEFLQKAKWIEEKVFSSITANVVQKSKEVRLEEKKEKGVITKKQIIPEEEPYIYYGAINEATKEIEVWPFRLKDHIPPEPKRNERYVEDNGRYDHLHATNNSVGVNEWNEDEVNRRNFNRNRERVENLPRFQGEERNESIQQISRMSEQLNITNPPHRQVHLSTPQQNQRMVNNWSQSEQLNVPMPQLGQVRPSKPQYNQRNVENFSRSGQDRDTNFMQYRNMHQEQRGPPPFNKTIRPPGFINQGNLRNENGRERQGQIGTYVQLALNSNAGPTVRGNMDNNKDREEQRGHTEYVRKNLKNLPMRRGIRGETTRAPGPPNPTSIDERIHQEIQMITTPTEQREPRIRQPHVTFPTDLLGIQTPGILGVPDPMLLPRNTTNQLLENDIHLGDENRRLEAQQPSNNVKGNEPDEPLYEEIKDRIDDNVEQPTPQSMPTKAFQLRQQTPPSIIVTSSPDNLPHALVSKTMARPPFPFQEQAPRQTPLPENTPWQEGDDLGAVGGLGRSERVQIEELQAEVQAGETVYNEDWEQQVQDEELTEDTWENDGLEWDNTALNWQEHLWQPRMQSAEEEQNELQQLINAEVLINHNLEKRINQSAALEQIYNKKNMKCSLLYEDRINTATTNPNYLHDNPKERIKMMRDIYVEVKMEKAKRIKALENVTEIETVRRSKRLSMRERKRYQ